MTVITRMSDYENKVHKEQDRECVRYIIEIMLKIANM